MSDRGKTRYLRGVAALLAAALLMVTCDGGAGSRWNRAGAVPGERSYGGYAEPGERPEEHEAAWERLPEGGYRVTVASGIHPEGSWTATVTLNQDAYAPGDTLTVAGELVVDSPYLADRLGELTGLVACLTARRLYDAKGDPHRRANTSLSTVLTPTGLPIEGYYPGQPSRKIGGLWTGPIDEIQVLPAAQIAREGGRLRVPFRLAANIDADFPAGVYRPEIKFYVLDGDDVVSLSAYPGLRRFVDGQMPEQLFETIRYSFWTYPLPVVRIGTAAPPRMVWTLFTGQLSNGTQGVVALEDRGRFAFTSNRTFQSEFVAPPVDRAGQPITYRLEPDLPLVYGYRMPNVGGKFQERRLPDFPLDVHSGWLEVTVVEPDGARRELGRAPFTGEGAFGPTTGDGRFDFQFRKWGRHHVELRGEIQDVWGHRYTGGGTYPVVVANRLTMDTSVKPGSPYFAGDGYSIMVVVNPPCPAEVAVRVRQFPAANAKGAVEGEVRRRANAFGYFITGPVVTFDAPGEYAADVAASYTDPEGRLWYGAQQSAGVVAPRTQDFVPHGLPWFEPPPEHGTPERYNLHREASAYRVDTPFTRTNCLPQMTLFYPYHLGDVAFIGLNDAWGGNALLPLLRVEDRAAAPREGQHDYPNGTIFGSRLGHPGEVAALVRRFAERMYLVTHMNGILRYDGASGLRPLMSTTSHHYPPQEYPEFITRLAYTYSAAIRPGFVVRQFVGDNSLPSSYWVTSEADFYQIGSGADALDDIYRLTGGAVERDVPTGAGRFGVYASMAAIEGKGAQADRVAAGGSEPMYAPMGTPFPLLIAVGPGLVLETGDMMTLGGTSFPPVEAKAFGEIVLPDGTRRTDEGSCNEIGKCSYPNIAFRVEQPGVYHVQQTITARGKTGGVTGTVDGRYVHFVLPHDAPPRLRLDQPPVYEFDPLAPCRISGTVAPDVVDGVIDYIMLVPGAVIDQGTLPLTGGGFHYDVYLPDIQRQFKAVDLFTAAGETRPADTMELTLFLEGRTAAGEAVYDARKIIFRGNRVFARGPMP